MIGSNRNGPHLVIVPATSLIVALGSRGLGLGTAGIIEGAAFGLLWSLALSALLARVTRRPEWQRRLANGFVVLAIVASGVMLGGGVMYGLLMRAAASAPADVLSAMMQPTIPFFIILNTPLELLIVPGAVFTTWQNDTRRRRVLAAAAAFYALRIWSYLAYVPKRMEIAAGPLSPQEIDWFQCSMEADDRSILLAVVFVVFTLAAFVPDPPR
jgi:hypothetical protein